MWSRTNILSTSSLLAVSVALVAGRASRTWETIKTFDTLANSIRNKTNFCRCFRSSRALNKNTTIATFAYDANELRTPKDFIRPKLHWNVHQISLYPWICSKWAFPPCVFISTTASHLHPPKRATPTTTWLNSAFSLKLGHDTNHLCKKLDAAQKNPGTIFKRLVRDYFCAGFEQTGSLKRLEPFCKRNIQFISTKSISVHALISAYKRRRAEDRKAKRTKSTARKNRPQV